ncbi:MAG: GAF domain-containing protein, partial [Syntrophaceae bacterium]
MLREASDTKKESQDEPRLYNVIIIKGYIEYLQKHYPDVDIDALLNYAGMSRYQLSDSEYWFTQSQADRFYDIAVKLTGNVHLAREAGQFSVISGSSIIYKYLVGFINAAAMYKAAQKITSLWTRGSEITVSSVTPNKPELISIPNPGVQEKLYQCENRLGVLEALGKVLTGKLARIEHPECIHRGNAVCRYSITLEISRAYRCTRVRNYVALAGLALLILLGFYLPVSYLMAAFLAMGLLVTSLTWWAEHLENLEHVKNIEETGKTAELLLEEIKSRYNDALLVQEIGQVGARLMDIDVLLDRIIQIMQKRLDFDRAAVALVDQKGSCLTYRMGYGYTPEQTKILNNYVLDVSDGATSDPLAIAFLKQIPSMVNDLKEVTEDFRPEARDLMGNLRARAFICVPIIFEGQSLGILAVERTTTPKPMIQSEVSLMVGIAQQIAISINNAHSFQRLQASEERYRELVQNANSIILRLDTQGHITFFNEFAQRFFNISEAEILGLHAQDTLLAGQGHLRDAFIQWIQGIVKTPETFMNTQTEGYLKNGRHVWIAWTNRLIKDERGESTEILCIGNDITSLKLVEQEKRKLELELQRAQKMEAIGTLAGGVAHDLNNILSGLVSYPDLLLMKIPSDSPLVKPLSTIRKAGEKASAIVQDLLTLARRGVSVSNVVQMNTVVGAYLSSPEFEALNAHHPKVRVETRLDARLMHVLGSEVHLSKTIMNLVTNAAEAMPEGGRVLISTQNVYIDTPVVGYDHVVEGEYVMVTVSDSGIGIAPEDLPRIFEP